MVSINRLQDTVTLVHVKGHQDKNKKRQLLWQAKLNIKSDTLTTQGRYMAKRLNIAHIQYSL